VLPACCCLLARGAAAHCTSADAIHSSPWPSFIHLYMAPSYIDEVAVPRHVTHQEVLTQQRMFASWKRVTKVFCTCTIAEGGRRGMAFDVVSCMHQGRDIMLEKIEVYLVIVERFCMPHVMPEMSRQLGRSGYAGQAGSSRRRGRHRLSSTYVLIAAAALGQSVDGFLNKASCVCL